MAACNEHCVLAVECLNSIMKENSVTGAKNQIQSDDKCYQLMMCNSIGTTVDCKYTIDNLKIYGKIPNMILLLWVYK